MSLISLSYVSAASRDMSKEDIENILETARRKNADLDITGMLLYRNGYFIQALEGEEKAVMALYDTIAQDDRHKNVLTVHKQEIDERSFGDWTMGFKNLENVNPDELDGYTDFLDQPFDVEAIKNSGSRAVTLLELFKEGGGY
jgi:hypothetical protein